MKAPEFISGNLKTVVIPSKPYRKGHHIKVTIYVGCKSTVISEYNKLPFAIFLIQRDTGVEIQQRLVREVAPDMYLYTKMESGKRNGKQLNLL